MTPLKRVLPLFLIALTAAFLLACSANEASAGVTIAVRGQARAVIVIDPTAPDYERNAASELASYLSKVTGAEFLVVSNPESAEGQSRIFVGQSDTAKSLLSRLDWNSLGEEGIVIKTVGRDLILAGGRPRGTLYAVYTLLEDVIGCRWWTSTNEYVPSKPTLRLSKLDRVYVPPLIYREAYWRDVIDRNPIFAVKLKLNGLYQPIAPEWGGHRTIIGGCHTFWQFLPADIYFKEHPDWYSENDGTRIPDGQLCLTNPQMKAEMIRVVLERIAQNPSAGMISVSQNDNMSACQCANCAEIVKEEGGESGLMIRFVNSVAEEVEKRYPDFLVDTLAYQYTRHIPKLARPRKNVMIRLCSIECDFSKPLDNPANAAFYSDLKDWAAISPRLFIWDYQPNFSNHLVPHPDFHVIGPNIRLFAAHKAVGVFEQGDGSNENANFSHLKLYLTAHLLWNPQADARKLTYDFLRGYYGKAAPFLQRYIDLTCNAAMRSKGRLTCFSPDDSYLTLDVMNSATVLFDQAGIAVKDYTEFLHRVKVERLALNHAWLLNTTIDRFSAGSLYPRDYQSMAEEFVTKSRAWGAGYIQNETPVPDNYAEILKQKGAQRP